ncbi:GDP-mannose 4,6-dehydratase [Candidatus Bathyarchaeota archaeon]|nr:GDP-mannose 4,6-dehydratase [Candidatus Bathyarchaeota archaeon]
MKSDDKKVLITGGVGFIASHLVDTLLDKHYYVIAYDNFDSYYSGKEENIRHNFKNPNFTLIKGDILDYETLRNVMKNIDVVFHLAAQPGVRYSFQNPVKTNNVNVSGTLNVLRAAKEENIKKVIFASSSSVYGSPKYMPVDEKHPTKPISIYGASKLAAENYCRIFSDKLGLPVIILRYHTVYGPRQRPDLAFFKWARQIFERKPITIYGNGTQTRDFTYIDDAINGTIKAASTASIEGEVFNIGGGSRISVNDVVNSLIRFIGINAEIVYESPKLGDVSDTRADISKAEEILGYTPKVNLEEGLKRFIKWFEKTKSRLD